jgi:hypothetical protein
MCGFCAAPKLSLTHLLTSLYQKLELVNLHRIGMRAFDCIAQESSSVSSLVVRGRLPPCVMPGSVTLRNLSAKLDTMKFFCHVCDDDADDRGDEYTDEDDF